jgi:ABC-2 type transport system ATP-binding protein
MSSHILPDVEAVCDAVGIINHGRLLAQDSVDNLRRATGGGMTVEVILAQPDAQVVKALQEMNCIREVEAEGQRLIIRTTGREEVRPQIIESIIKARGQVLLFGKKEASLEEILLRVVEEGK